MTGRSGLFQRVGPALVRSWERRSFLTLLLSPFSLLYAALVFLRRGAYRFGLFHSHRVGCPVIVVGNVVAGGAGKTPTTIGIVQHLRSRGLTVGVVSRGYGRSSDAIQAVAAQDDPKDVGDEPLLIARATGTPVFVGRDRVAAASALLIQNPQTQVIVCDDGLQHYALYRNIEICVMDERATGNGWLLPAGPLREFWPSAPLSQCGQDTKHRLILNTGFRKSTDGFSAQRSLSAFALTRTGKSIALNDIAEPVLALAGIAKPDQFFSALREMGVVLKKTLALPDHFDFLHLDAGLLKGFQVLCTEKDAVKLWRIYPDALAVPLQQTLEPAFLNALDGMLESVHGAKLSFPHGHQTT